MIPSKRCVTSETLRVFLVSGLVLLANSSGTAEGGWTRKADMPTARSHLATSVVDGRIYAIGGAKISRGPPFEPLSTVEAYDPATDTWTRKADMPTPRLVLSTSVVDGIIYAIGGWQDEGWFDLHQATVEAYDPASDTWTRKADMPTGRSRVVTAVFDGRIYAIGGCPTATCGTPVRIEVYDPVTDTWDQRMPAPALLYRTGGVVEGKLYALGGEGSGYPPPLTTLWQYDPATDTWMRQADVPTGRTQVATAVVDGKVYVIGGTQNPSEYDLTPIVEAYDPVTDTWTRQADLPTLRLGLAASVVAGEIYVIGGSVAADAPQATIEVFDPDLGATRVDALGWGLIKALILR